MIQLYIPSGSGKQWKLSERPREESKQMSMTNAAAIASARHQLSVERKNTNESAAVRLELLDIKEDNINAWAKAHKVACRASELTEEFRKIVESQVIEIASFRAKQAAGSKRTSLLEGLAIQFEYDKARFNSMTAEERLAECEGEPEIIGVPLYGRTGFRTTSTERDRQGKN